MKYTCSKCQGALEAHRIGKQRYCLKCHREHMRKARPKYSELTFEERMKGITRSLTHHAIKRGRLVKGLCEVCGTKFVEAHHDNYERPLEVRWLCRPHHLELHREKREQP